jgi:hypothetical protein
MASRERLRTHCRSGPGGGEFTSPRILFDGVLVVRFGHNQLFVLWHPEGKATS